MRTIDLEARNRNTTGERSELPTSPGAPAVIVSCIDARTDPAHIAGVGPGDAAVFRTVGGRVTDETVEQIGMLAGLAKIVAGDEAELDVAVIHHTDCGASRFGLPPVRDKINAVAGVTQDRVDAFAIADPAASLRADVDRLRASSLPAGLSVTGYLYDVETGELRVEVATDRLGAGAAAT